MLRGRESLVRLIGKRRRIESPDQRLSHILSLVSTDSQYNGSIFELHTSQERKDDKNVATLVSLSHDKISNVTSLGVGESSSGVIVKADNEIEQKSDESDSVSCPVCGKNTEGSQINEHLDICLRRETKRKITQRTLLQFNIISKSNKKKDGDTLAEDEAFQGHKRQKHLTNIAGNNEPSCAVDQDIMCISTEASTNANGDNHKHLNVLDFNNTEVSDNICRKDINERTGADKETNFPIRNSASRGNYHLSRIDRTTVFSASLHEDIKKAVVSSNLQTESVSGTKAVISEDDSFMGILDTHIVGRRFNLETKAKEGEKILLVRDQENPKDKNAIKVVYMNCEDGRALGHLPRELALYLSPLLDCKSLHIEGIISSVPPMESAVVPVKLHCQKQQIDGDEQSKSEELLQSVWPKVVTVVKLMNDFPTDVPKYQRNFMFVIQTALERYSHLFTCKEKASLESFQSLSGDGQRLFIRLYQRKGPWFRISQISYSDINDVDSACKELLEAEYASSLELEVEKTGVVGKEMFSVLTVQELKQLSSLLMKKKKEVHSAKKEELLEWLVSAASQRKYVTSLHSKFLNLAEFCIKISQFAEVLLWRIQRLFFLNGEQDISTFLLVDMGLIRYPEYNIQHSQNIFQCPSDFLSYEQALEVAQIMDMAIEANDIPKATKCMGIAYAFLNNSKLNSIPVFSALRSHWLFLSRYSAVWIYTKVLTLGVSILERDHRYEDAIKLLRNLLSREYCPGQRGYWILRLSIDLEHIGHIEESLQEAEKAIADDWVRSGDRMALQRRILRLGKPPRRWKKPEFAKAVFRKIKEVKVKGRPLNSSIGEKSVFYGYDEQQCSVEELALQYYAGDEGGRWQGVHTESGIWLTFFGLLMWDILFADIPDVFLTPFQTAPLDLGTDSFFLSRKSLIDAQVNKINEGMVEDILTTSWEKHYGTACQGVNWERHTLEELKTIALCVGGAALAVICKLLAENYRSWTSGMPDLLLWRISCHDLQCNRETDYANSKAFRTENCEGSLSQGNNCVKGEAKLVEVKGPRDRLSEQQRAWVLVLMDAGLDVEVCKIYEHSKRME